MLDMTLANQTNVVTMSSREIAELTGKKISAVHSDIRAMVPALYAADNGEKVRSYAWGTTKNEMIAFLNHNKIQGITINFDDRGYVYEFLLDRRHTEILVTGYDIKRRAAVIDRWFALESGSAQLQLSEMEMITAIASNAARNEKRISAVEQDVEQIKQGTIPVGYQGYSYLRATYGLSDAKSRQLVMAWSVPYKKVPHVAPGGQVIQMSVVHEESFEKALRQMMKEAEQRGTQWHHPKMGRFSITDRKSAA